MKILHINPVLNVKKGGGTANRNLKLIQYLKKVDVDNVVITLCLGQDFELEESELNARKITIPVLNKRFFLPFPSFFKIFREVKNCDVVHMMSHWTVLNVMVFWVCSILNKPYVICPAGSMAIFGRSKILKKIYNLSVGNSIIKNASAIIAVTQSEKDYMVSIGIDHEKIIIIPNGVDSDATDVISSEKIRQKIGVYDNPFILFMGRLNPIKGIDLLIEAFIQIAKELPVHHLIVAGPDEGLKTSLAKAVEEANLSNRVHFVGFLDKNERQSSYREAEFLVIPSRSEAMSLVVLEAGIEETPSIFTDQCGLEFLAENQLGLQVKVDSHEISKAIQLMATNVNKAEMGKELKKFIQKRFLWDVIVTQYTSLFEKIKSLR
jgi:glycosyltransferase involved in cell wall biosynthesis